ncbi:MAG TPA: hypothetical protein VF518_00195 [Polyangia bacterium]
MHGIRVRQLDVSTSAGRAAAAERGVLGVPTFLFLDSTGKEIARLVGQQPQEVLIHGFGRRWRIHRTRSQGSGAGPGR